EVCLLVSGRKFVERHRQGEGYSAAIVGGYVCSRCRVLRRCCRLDQNQKPWSALRLNERRNHRVGRVFRSVLAVMDKRDAARLALRNRGLAFFDSRPAGFWAI